MDVMKDFLKYLEERFEEEREPIAAVETYIADDYVPSGVTSFTVAHSVTLSLAALDVFNPPGAIVEVLIAASIVYMAIENFFVRSVNHRWPLTFAFGLVHGFGFAGVLKNYGIPREALVPALASFNIGVGGFPSNAISRRRLCPSPIHAVA